MRGEEEHPGSFHELHLGPSLPSSGNDGPLLQDTCPPNRVFTGQKLLISGNLNNKFIKGRTVLADFELTLDICLQSASDIGDDVTPYNIISKLSLLALHFPRLRIIWSRSLHATAEIFAVLKANQDEPDETKALRVGVPSEEGIIDNDVR